jgi:Pectobacterium phage endonuclease
VSLKESSKIRLVCVECGAVFFRWPSDIKCQRNFCSRACDIKWHVLPWIDRFWSYIGKKTACGCFLWTGVPDKHGYGAIKVAESRVLAHRIAYELMVGRIPDGLCVLHRCDLYYPAGDTTYRRCVNPTHLFLGTQADNMTDMASKSRGNVGEKCHSSKLTPQQVCELRERYSLEDVNNLLAEQYGVSMTALRYILIGRTWKYLLEPPSP